MRITVSQQDLPTLPTGHAGGRHGKKILITFESGKVVDKFVIDKAEDFLAAVDKFAKKHNNLREAISKSDLEFANTGLLTERIIRAIIVGLQF